jgi:hypothetical protein
MNGECKIRTIGLPLFLDRMSAAQQLKPVAPLQEGQAEIDVSDRAEGKQHTLNTVESLTIVDRNAISCSTTGAMIH